AGDQNGFVCDGPIEGVALDRVDHVLQIERPVSARGVRRVEQVGHRGDRFLDQAREIAQVHAALLRSLGALPAEDGTETQPTIVHRRRDRRLGDIYSYFLAETSIWVS